MISIKHPQTVARAHDASALGDTQVQLTDLPSDLLAQILGHTSGGLVLQLAPSGKVFRDVARNNQVWKKLREQRLWRPTAGVVDIVRAGADRDAYQVQVMEKKLLWDRLGDEIQTLRSEVRKLTFHAPVPRGGCGLDAPTTSLRVRSLAQTIGKLQKRQAALTSELNNDNLAVTGKGWRRQWG